MIDLTNPAAHCVFLFLQVILAPILYPYGYILQAVFLLGTAFHHKTLRQRESCLLLPLLVVYLLSAAAIEDNIPFAGRAVRLIGAALIACCSMPLHVLSVHLMDPEVAIFLAVECLAAPHLYSFGYLAQLVLFHYLAWRQAQAQAQAVKLARKTSCDDPPQTTPSPIDDAYVCKICFDRRVDVVFGSCGHVCCQRCVDDLVRKMSRQTCPFCNTHSANHIRLYFP
eukprot:gene3731-4080_t